MEENGFIIVHMYLQSSQYPKGMTEEEKTQMY